MNHESLAGALVLGAAIMIVIFAFNAWMERQRSPSSPPSLPNPASAPPESATPLAPGLAMYLVLEGPEKALLVRLDPFANLTGPSSEGTWAEVEDKVHVRVDGLDSQLGMVLLDLWVLLGEEEARATLERPVQVLPEGALEVVGPAMGGLQAMEGWLEVPSLASYQPPAPEEFPALLPLTLRFPKTTIQLFMDRGRLLETAQRRTHPTAAPRDSRPQDRGPVNSPEQIAEVIAAAHQRYASKPLLSLTLLEHAFGAGPINPDMGPLLGAALAEVWGLALRNAGRIDEAIARFTEGLELADDDDGRQSMRYNRGYARLMSLMVHRQADAQGLVHSSIVMNPAHVPALKTALEDFEVAAALNPQDIHAHSQIAICARCIAELKPEEENNYVPRARQALEAALALNPEPAEREHLTRRLAALG